MNAQATDKLWIRPKGEVQATSVTPGKGALEISFRFRTQRGRALDPGLAPLFIELHQMPQVRQHTDVTAGLLLAEQLHSLANPVFIHQTIHLATAEQRLRFPSGLF